MARGKRAKSERGGRRNGAPFLFAGLRRGATGVEGMTLEIRYVKRLEMRFDYDGAELPEPTLPSGYFWAPWSATQTATHARLIYTAFHRDLDARVFPTFRSYDACERLMRAVASKKDFVPKATWLIGRRAGPSDQIDYCATIQGMTKGDGACGGILNVAVIPGARRRGLGRALVLKALAGFRDVGCVRASLEATAENVGAVRLYASLGFVVSRVSYVESFVETGKSS